jgi:glycine C-acetyltransferase
MLGDFGKFLEGEIQQLRDSGLFKAERLISSPQAARISANGQPVINMCANNYLGLSNHPDLVKFAKQALDQYGYGLSSVRFICGTQTIHKELEKKIAAFLGVEDCILYSSCFDANGGLFETLMGADDAIISDSLNHASIIDGIRLSKAQRLRYENNSMQDLEAQLQQSKSARYRMIATDGVFSMDGTIANLPKICELAEKYQALVMVDDSHAVGFMGKSGKGTHEHHNVMGKIDIITGTLGKALGGASGGYTAGKREIIEWLRQRSRPYLFSNSLAPVVTSASIFVLDRLVSGNELRQKLWDNTRYFREQMNALGFNIVPGVHPIVPVMLGDAVLAQRMAARMLELGVYVIGFSFPVVPKGLARIRTQISAGHSQQDLEAAVSAFAQAGHELGVIKS